MNIRNTIIKHYKNFFDLHAKGIALNEDDQLNIDWAEDLVKNCFISNIMHSVFTIHSAENDEIIKVVGTKDKAIQEVKEFKDDHAYTDFYWQEQVLQ